MKQIETYLQMYNSSVSGTKVSSTLNNIAIHYVPMVNPDGVTISQYGPSSIRNASLRKNVYKMTRNVSYKLWKANARGVDPNANYPYYWTKSSGSPRYSGYSGVYAGSEPETKALIKLKTDLKKSKNLRGSISYHCMGNILYGDCSFQPKNSYVYKMTRNMYNLAKSLTGYKCADTPYNKIGRGCSGDWDKYVLGVPGTTIEVGDMSAPVPISRFPKVWAANKYVVIKEAMLLD